MSDQAYVNKNLVSWSDLRWQIALPDAGGQFERYYGFKAIAFGAEKRERPPQYGQNRSHAPIGLPSGKYTPPAPKITWHAHAADARTQEKFESFTAMLKRAAPVGPSGLYSIGNVRMNWILEVVNRLVYVQYRWFDVYLVGNDASWEETPEGLFKEMEFSCTRFITNDTTMYDSTEE